MILLIGGMIWQMVCPKGGQVPLWQCEPLFCLWLKGLAQAGGGELKAEVGFTSGLMAGVTVPNEGLHVLGEGLRLPGVNSFFYGFQGL